MVNNNKILTVSYGTFSCTLEGFDDSFDTMKAIAEYFRDLASDDRYFGAEPPVPDADMLARIAQREISRKVEAHEEDGGGILLRAQDAPQAAAGLTTGAAVAPIVSTPKPEPKVRAPEVAEVPVEVEDVETGSVEKQEDPAVSFFEASPHDAFQPEIKVPSEDLTAVVAEEIYEEEVSELVEPVLADTQEQLLSEDLDPVAAETEAADVVQDVKEPFDDNVAEIEVEIEVAELVEEADVEPDSIAAKLQRIRAVVSRNEARAEAVDYAEDEHADAYVAAVASDMTDALNEDDATLSIASEDSRDDEVLDALKRLDAAFEPEADEVEDLADDLLPMADSSGLLEAFADIEEPSADQPEKSAENLVDAPEDSIEEAPVYSLTASDGVQGDDDAVEDALDEDVLGRMQDALADDNEVDSETLETVEDDALFEGIGEISQDDADAVMAENIMASYDNEVTDPEISEQHILGEVGDDLPETGLETDDWEDGGTDTGNLVEDEILEEEMESPQVIKVNRLEFEAAISAGELEEITEEEVAETATSSLSPEAEDELMRELAEVEAELDATSEAGQETLPNPDFEEFAADTDQALSETFQAVLPEVSELDEEDDEDLSRLMAAADEKMGGEETSSTREAYNQMRAAVAVTEFERSAGGSADDEAADDVYREDLANVVRPRRPVSAGIAPERPATESRPAPLKLVAEQRIDAEAGLAHRGPVRPRRVASTHADDGVGDGDSSFADFASEMGASELSELLEAAAAYLSFVEGRAQFSRPQLMNKVRQIESGNFNREDGLRSFGRLLREGKIEKTGGGRFTASGDIGFRPDERVAVG